MVCDEGIAPAMSEEQNATDDPFAVDRKLTAKVNKATLSSYPKMYFLSHRIAFYACLLENTIMETFDITRFVFLRALAFIYCIAFIVAINQFRPLCGSKGLLPVPLLLDRISWRHVPSLFCLHYSDRFAAILSWLGLGLALIALSGIADQAGFFVSISLWFALWLLYLSFVNVGQTFYAFGWESMLLETGFLTIFLSPAQIETPIVLIWLLRWLLFRNMFGAGLIKLRADPCWWNLTCLDYHYQTQPMPNPLSWFFHRFMSHSFHKTCVLVTHFVELVVPFAYFAPAPYCYYAGLLTVYFQLMLILSGNLSWLNYLTIVLCISCFDDAFWSQIIPWSAVIVPTPIAWDFVIIAFALLIIGLSIRPTINLLMSGQLMNASFDPLHLVNTYGAFGSVSSRRFEVIIEGTHSPVADDFSEWHEYEFRGKPGDISRRPPIVAPYHLRLGWLMWFAAMGSASRYPWLIHLIAKMLAGDKAVLKLLLVNPFSDKPPMYIRALLYEYEFTKPDEHSKNWWKRRRIGVYLEPYSLDDAIIEHSLRQRGG